MANNSSRTLKLIFAGEDKGATKTVKGLGGALGGLNGQIGGVGAGLAGVFSVGAITAGATKAIQGWQQQGLAVAQVKRLTGESAENASLLNFAAQQSGIDATKAATAWRFLAKNIQNGKVAAEGITTKDAAGNLLPFEQILGNVADKFHALPPGIERTSLALKLFGRGGADMVKVLAKGSDGIEALRSEMQKYGLEFSDQKLHQIQKYVETQRDLQAILGGIEVSIGSKIGPALGHLEELFVKLPAPIREDVAGMAALAAALGGLVVGVGALGPVVGRGVTILRGKTAATEAASAADVDLAAADLTAAEAEGTLAAAWAAGTPTSEAAAGARGSLAAADEALAAGATTATAAVVAENEAILAQITALGGLGLAAKGALGAVGAISDQKHLPDKTVFEHLSGNSAQQFIDQAKGSEKALRDLKAEAKKAGVDMPTLDEAIRRVSASNKQHKKSTDDSTHSLAAERKELKAVAKAHDELNAKVDKAVSKAIDQRNAQQGVIDAHQQTIDDEAELAKAQQAAVGNSDEYRQARQDIASALKDEASAKSDVTSAERDLSQAEVDARKHIDDLTDARVRAVQAERDAVLALHEAEAENRKVLADPRSTPLEKERASVALADAKDNEASASKDVTSAQRDELAAKRAGIAGDQGVIDAQKRVAEAKDKVRESSNKVADAEAAARKVLHDAADEVQADSKKVQQDKADEAAAWFNLAKLTTDATGAALIYYALLKQMGADPVLQQMIAAGLNGVTTGILTPTGQGELANGRPAPHAPNKPARLRESGVTVNITHINQGTPAQVGRSQVAATKRTMDKIAAGWG